MRRLSTFAARGAGLLVGVALITLGASASPQRPQQGPAVVTVSYPIEREVIDWDEYTGRLEAVETVNLRARVSGFLLSADFQEGAMVEAGQVLFKLDPSPFQAEVDRAEAQVKQAEAQAENASTEFVRLERLRASGGGSEKEYQDARYNKLQTAAAVAAAKPPRRTRASTSSGHRSRRRSPAAPVESTSTAGNLITGGTASGNAA
jgi:multidrug efflux pump subunit AcrA (membrane-fusion protein)